MNKISILLIFVVAIGYSQKKRSSNLGQITSQEVSMTSFKKDSTANALVLYEHANTYLSEKHNLSFRTDFYHKIKLFDRKDFHRATVKVRLYGKEKSIDVKAYSYNLEEGVLKKTELLQKEIFTKQLDKKWKEVVFTIPNIKEGTVIEYKYSVISPYPTINDWYFQSDIPKLKSDFSLSYLGNYKYNIRLTGFLKLTKDVQKVEKKCVYVPGIGNGNCANFYYSIEDIPAFKEEEFMLSKENFLSRLSFDLISITNTNGQIKKYTKTWKDADKSFKNDFLDGQTSKKKHFAKKLPKDILSIQNQLEKAKSIFKYIQNRFTWNDRYWTQDRIKIKEIFEERNGGVDGINLSLYNSLQAANIESYIVMIATRNKGLPTRLYPVTSDFNYVIIKTVVDGKTYFLDATDKFSFFGQIPMRCLNGEGRVLDFKKGSYWEKIAPILTTKTNIRAYLTLNEKAEVKGKITVEKKGYHASENREKISFMNQDDYLERLEATTIDFEIEDFDIKNLNDKEESLLEIFKFQSDSNEESPSSLRINPFLYFRINENPFKLEERNYPVDFGYPKTYTYSMSVNIPKGYVVDKIPETQGFKLPNNGGAFILKANKDDTKVVIHYRYQIKKKIYSKEEYYYLKEFFKKVIKVHTSYIEFTKIR